MHQRRQDSNTAAARIDDAVLVRAALDRDPQAAARIVKRYAPLVRWRLRASFADADLDDHVQEVFLRCFTSLQHLRDPEALRSFLIGITLRWAAMERRRCRLRGWEQLTSSGDLPEHGAPQPPIESRQVASRTNALLDRLQPESARVLELRFIEERELKEVAKGMGVSRATAQRHVVNASERVRALAQSEPVIVEHVGLRSGGAARRSVQGAST